MCWAVPAKVVSIDSDVIATVDLGQNTLKKVAIGVDNLKVGDYVMVHAGVIIAKLSKEEVMENVKFIEEQIREVAEMIGEDPNEAIKDFEKSVYSILSDEK
ncbi:HypC/HybG/HupF family hydrogenase formation chaperone [Sulfurisphaera javensis]|uniref:HypC/HybG/HupF family hydrogenase formation chaperone n=1 Tax=Sulfurisphaera javensis TaxID=2049879 RepID=A0AAT9GVI2_9CREN